MLNKVEIWAVEILWHVVIIFAKEVVGKVMVDNGNSIKAP